MKRFICILMFVVLLVVAQADTSYCATCKGDLNGDGVVTGADIPKAIQIMGAVFPNPLYNACFDFDEDGAITGADVAGFIAVFGTVCAY